MFFFTVFQGGKGANMASLTAVLLQCLQAAIGPDQAMRKAAEDEVTRLGQTCADFAPGVAGLMVEPSVPAPVRQLAGVILRQ